MKGLHDFIRSLHPAVEFGIVVAVAFGWLVLGSHVSALDPEPLEYPVAALRDLLIWELFVLALLGWFLAVRRWDFAGQKIFPTLVECVQGVVIGIAVIFGYQLLASLIWSVFPPAEAPAAEFITGLDLLTAVLASIINPVFEEVLVCAYIITAVQKPLGAGIAILVSASIRAAYHTYQGAEAFFLILLMGFAFAFWFVRTRRLWPLIVAHGLMDFVGLLGSVRQ